MTIDLAGVVILAGGESTRMGSPKALLKVPRICNMGKILEADKQVSLLQFHTQEMFWLDVPFLIADNQKHFLSDEIYQKHFFLTPIADYIANAGALSAITSAMQHLAEDNQSPSNAYLLVVNCDTLIHSLNLLEIFSRQSKKYQAYYLKDKKGQDYPLLGLYRLDLLYSLKYYIENGNRSVMKFLSQVNSKVITMPDKWQYLANFNTPEEFKLALEKFKKSNP